MVRELRGKTGEVEVILLGYIRMDNIPLLLFFFPPLTLSLYEMVYYYYITNAFEDYIKLVILIKSS
jgi:hypothetical protein